MQLDIERGAGLAIGETATRALKVDGLLGGATRASPH
jgi:hypothetical protein